MDQVAADDAELDDWARTLRKSKRGGRGQAEGRCFYCSESSARFSEASQISLFPVNVPFLFSFLRFLSASFSSSSSSSSSSWLTVLTYNQFRASVASYRGIPIIQIEEKIELVGRKTKVRCPIFNPCKVSTLEKELVLRNSASISLLFFFFFCFLRTSEENYNIFFAKDCFTFYVCRIFYCLNLKKSSQSFTRERNFC